jgi:hypothetical protein
MGEYKRHTKIVDLPSGKKVEVIEYFSKYERDLISQLMLKGKKIKGAKMKELSDGESAFAGMEFDMDTLAGADSIAREMAIKKLIDVDGKEYEATVQSIRDFINEVDGDFVDKAINEANKKKPIEKK